MGVVTVSDEEVIDRLDTIIYILASEYVDPEATIAENIVSLDRFEFSNQELADLIGTTKGTVKTTKTELRSEGRID